MQNRSVFIVIALVVVVIGGAFAANIVRFKDTNLEAHVRNMRDWPMGVIDRHSVQSITSLRITSPVNDLSGLQYFSNLKSLTISSGTISDLRPLRRLTNLQELEIHGGNISDLKPLSELRNLRKLILTNNKISDLAPLVHLQKLQHLELSGNKIADVSPLSHHTELERLVLANNQISTIPNLSKTRLRSLDLSDNNIKDISPLNTITQQLRDLYLGDNLIEDISVLSRLKNVTHLDLSNNQITSIEALSSIYSAGKQGSEEMPIWLLDLSHNQITAIDTLTNLRINALHLEDNQIIDAEPLTKIERLERLSIKGNPIENMAVYLIYNIPTLRILDVEHVNSYRYLDNARELLRQGEYEEAYYMAQEAVKWNSKLEEEVLAIQNLAVEKLNENAQLEAEQRRQEAEKRVAGWTGEANKQLTSFMIRLDQREREWQQVFQYMDLAAEYDGNIASVDKLISKAVKLYGNVESSDFSSTKLLKYTDYSGKVHEYRQSSVLTVGDGKVLVLCMINSLPKGAADVTVYGEMLGYTDESIPVLRGKVYEKPGGDLVQLDWF